jgi:formate/nitrite transporter FocA (FNT family)
VNRHEVANLSVLALIVVAAVAGAVRADWEWWQVLLASIGAFFAGGLFVERVAPGSRVLEALGRAPRP